MIGRISTGIAAAVLLMPALADAQGTFGGYSNNQSAPNYNYRNTQPLSPYLNLLRGGNSAVNYFYGVQPNQSGGPLGAPYSVGPGSMGRQTFFPQIDNLYELEDAKQVVGIPPTGHPFGFSNGLGYFGSSNQQGMRGGNQQRQGAGSGGLRQTGSGR